MQITSSAFTSSYTIRPDSTQNESARVPVIIDQKPSFELEDQNQTLPVISAATQQQEITTNDRQQAQFIRLFATQAEPSSESGSNLPALTAQALPKGVQQYLQISQLSSPRENRFDETV